MVSTDVRIVVLLERRECPGLGLCLSTGLRYTDVTGSFPKIPLRVGERSWVRRRPVMVKLFSWFSSNVGKAPDFLGT